MDCFLPSEEETILNVHFPDKQETLSIDAIDIEILARTVQEQQIPEDSSFGEELAYQFKKKYNRTMTKNAAIHLWNAAHKVLEDVKKKLYLGPELSAIMEEQDNSPEENSTSSV